MTEDEAKLERQLLEATEKAVEARRPHVVARSPDRDTRDPETAALAEGWQALGQLLAAAEVDFRPEPLLRELRRRRFRERIWRGGALLAAAVLLIGVGLAWYLNHSGALNERPNQPAAASSGLAKSPDVSPTKANDALPAPNSVATTAATPAGWDQSLDQQISEADESVQNARTLGDASDDLIDQLDKQLVSFRQDVESNPL
jgi:hypothetical protein